MYFYLLIKHSFILDIATQKDLCEFELMLVSIANARQLTLRSETRLNKRKEGRKKGRKERRERNPT